MSCCICYTENVTRLGCAHQICSSCLNSLIVSDLPNRCPICRSNITTISSNLDVSRDLINSVPHDINIFVNSPKGTSLPITTDELQILAQLFGVLEKIDDINKLDEYLDKKIMIQQYINNSWYIGDLISIEDNKIIIENCIYIQRVDGKIYNTSPTFRNCEVNNRDQFFLIH